MSLATTTDTAVIKPAPLSKYEIQRNERHANAQIRSDAKRREKNARAETTWHGLPTMP